ncbi:MAG TPA: sugar phosphate isomerase/epimerase family protein [bacterium]|nr:sugar phosphate isomerase/epimerase family protein [bacterium]HQL63030.1 sugar phosphate isomerase/epimerase family protein [bacterium]
MSIEVGVNMEYVRSADKSFAWGVEKAAQIGYKYIEPMVHWGRELLSEAGYFHSVSMLEDPLEIKELMDRHGVKASGLSAHCPLMRPEIAVDYLKQAIRWAVEVGTDVCNTDEGLMPAWMDEKTAFQVMRYTLKSVAPVAERHKVKIGIEPHHVFTVRTEKLIEIADLAESPNVGFNYDCGNAYLGGKSDPYEMLEAIAPRTFHVHAKDISIEQSEDERGKVTGTPVGCACGDGVIDWTRIVRILKNAGFNGVLSVECGTIEQAEKSLKHLNDVIKKEGAV